MEVAAFRSWDRELGRPPWASSQSTATAWERESQSPVFVHSLDPWNAGGVISGFRCAACLAPRLQGHKQPRMFFGTRVSFRFFCQDLDSVHEVDCMLERLNLELALARMRLTPLEKKREEKRLALKKF